MTYHFKVNPFEITMIDSVFYDSGKCLKPKYYDSYMNQKLRLILKCRGIVTRFSQNSCVSQTEFKLFNNSMYSLKKAFYKEMM